jgi:hypothetical protein
MLAIENNQLRSELKTAQTKLAMEQHYQRKRFPGGDQELKDLLRAGLVFLKQADKKAVFARTSGVGEIIAKMEGVPGVKDG